MGINAKRICSSFFGGYDVPSLKDIGVIIKKEGKQVAQYLDKITGKELARIGCSRGKVPCISYSQLDDYALQQKQTQLLERFTESGKNIAKKLDKKKPDVGTIHASLGIKNHTPKISDGDIGEAIARYQDSDHINELIRKEFSHGDAILDEGMKRAIPTKSDSTAYRGISSWAINGKESFDLDNPEEVEKVLKMISHNPAYTSLSQSENVARDFTGGSDKGLMIRASLPKGTKALYSYRGHEVILPRKANFANLKLDKANRIITCDYVIPDKLP